MNSREMKSEIFYYLDLCAMIINNDLDTCLDGAVKKQYKEDLRIINKVLSNLYKYDLVRNKAK